MNFVVLTNHTRQNILDAEKAGKVTVIEGKVTIMPKSREYSMGYKASDGATYSMGIGTSDVQKLGLKVGSEIKVYIVPSGGIVHMVETK